MALLSLPLVVAFLSFLAGLLPALRFAVPGWLPLAGAVAALLAAALLRERSGRIALFVAIGLAGAALGAREREAVAGDCRARIPDGTPVEVWGTMAASRIPGAVPESRPAPLLPVRVREVRVEGKSVPGCGGEIRVRLPREGAVLPAGTEVRVSGEWRRLQPPAVRSAWPRDARFAGFVLAEAEGVGVLREAAGSPLLRLRGRTELHVHGLFPRHGALADALLLGRREAVDPVLRERFARAGLAHLLAISGMHVGLLAGMLLLAGKLLRVPRRRMAWATIGAISLYLLLIGAPASAVRAGIMISLALLGVYLQRPFAALPVVTAAALVILAHRPTAVLEPGFQLSFAGVTGILLFRSAILRRIPYRWREPGTRKWLAETATVSAAAFLATAPVAAHHFGLVAPVSILANFLAVPLLGVALTGILSAVLTEPLLPPLGRALASGAGATLDLLERIAAAAGAIPYGHAWVGRPSWLLWGSAAAALLLALDLAWRLRRPVRRGVGVVAAAALLVAWPAVAAPRAAALEIHFLDVGQGDATLIRTPADRWIMIDAGVRSEEYDAGERRVLPFLRANRVDRLEAMILTHPHADHIGGAPAVLRAVEVGRVVEPGHPSGSPAYLELLRVLEARKVLWIGARAGRTIRLDGVTLEILWPDGETIDSASDVNDISAVVHLRYGDFAALFTGDAYADTERELVRRHGEALRADVLKAGHHGSRTSTSAAFLEAVRPELVVISAGRRNRYGHPAPEVLRRLDERGIGVARTDRDGTITVRVEAPGTGWRRVDR